MKRYAKIILFIYLMVLMTGISGQTVFAEQNTNIEKNGVYLTRWQSEDVKGKIVLSGTTGNEKIKIMVKKDDYQQWYDVNIVDDSFEEEIWLTEGKGNYTVTIMVHKEGRKYSVGPSINVNNIEETNKYLVSTKHVESSNAEIIKLSDKIVEGKNTDREKAKAIYDWVSENIQYDYVKFNKHQNGDYDNKYGALNTLKEKKGVCYDYSTLTAALGRAAGLQVKIIKGQAITSKYSGSHAWNEIYISEEGKWINLDTTFGSTSLESNFDDMDFEGNHIKESEY